MAGKIEISLSKGKFYPEYCCEQCMEIIACYFDCPECGEKYAHTDICGEAGVGIEFLCRECGTEFVISD